MKAYRTYKGVKIHIVKELICGSDLKEFKTGELKPCKGKYDTYYQYKDSYKHDTIKDCKQAIDNIYNKISFDNEFTQKDFEQIMNN